MIPGIIATSLVTVSVFIVDEFLVLKRLSTSVIVTTNPVMSVAL